MTAMVLIALAALHVMAIHADRVSENLPVDSAAVAGPQQAEVVTASAFEPLCTARPNVGSHGNSPGLPSNGTRPDALPAVGLLQLAGLDRTMHEEFTRMLLHAPWPRRPAAQPTQTRPAKHSSWPILTAAAQGSGVPPERHVPGVQRVLSLVSEHLHHQAAHGLASRLSAELELLPQGPTYAFLRR